MLIQTYSNSENSFKNGYKQFPVCSRLQKIVTFIELNKYKNYNYFTLKIIKCLQELFNYNPITKGTLK